MVLAWDISLLLCVGSQTDVLLVEYSCCVENAQQEEQRDLLIVRLWERERLRLTGSFLQPHQNEFRGLIAEESVSRQCLRDLKTGKAHILTTDSVARRSGSL